MLLVGGIPSLSWILALTLSMVSEDSVLTDDIDENLHITMVMVPASGATSGVQTGFLNKHRGFFSHRGFPNRIIQQGVHCTWSCNVQSTTIVKYKDIYKLSILVN